MSDQRSKKNSKKIPNFKQVAKDYLFPIFGDQGSIWSLVTTIRRELFGTILDDLTSDPAEVTHMLIKLLKKKGLTDLAESAFCFRKLRNFLVHGKIVNLGFLQEVLDRVVSLCTWTRQYAKTTASNSFIQNDISDVLNRVYSLARTVGIVLPTTNGSNVTSTVGPNVHRGSNTNRYAPPQSFLTAGDPEPEESDEEDPDDDEEDSSRSYDVPAHRNNNPVDEDEDSIDNDAPVFLTRAPKVPARPNNNNNNVLNDEDCSDDDAEMHSCEEVSEVSVPVSRQHVAPNPAANPRHSTQPVKLPSATPNSAAKPKVAVPPNSTQCVARADPLVPPTTAQVPPTVLPKRRLVGGFLRIGQVLQPTPAPQPPQQDVAPPPQPQPQPGQAPPFRGSIGECPNYQNSLKGVSARVLNGRFRGRVFTFIRPNGSNYLARCPETGEERWFTVASTQIEVLAPVARPAVIIQRVGRTPNNTNVVFHAPQAAAEVPVPQTPPQQQHQVAPPVQPQDHVMTAAAAKQNFSQVIKGKTLTLRGGRYEGSTGVFCNWNGNNWRWRCVGHDMCDRCANEPNFKHASPLDTEIEIHW